jgi:hypothetical protein
MNKLDVIYFKKYDYATRVKEEAKQEWEELFGITKEGGE